MQENETVAIEETLAVAEAQEAEETYAQEPEETDGNKR